MSVTKLSNVVTVTALAANASVTVAHGLMSENSGLMPSRIQPAESTRIKVTAATCVAITFKNVGSATETAQFDCSYDAEMENNNLHSWWAGSSQEDQSRICYVAAPAAAAVAVVHANLLATALNPFPGPFTNPVVPRIVSATFGALWDGGDITLVGTNQWDEAITEVIADNPGATVNSVNIYKTVTSATKQTVGVVAANVSLGIGNKLGVVADITDTVGVLLCEDVAEAVTVDATRDAFTPTTAPNAARNYKLICNVA